MKMKKRIEDRGIFLSMEYYLALTLYSMYICMYAYINICLYAYICTYTCINISVCALVLIYLVGRLLQVIISKYCFI